jgi:hypothetical protein
MIASLTALIRYQSLKETEQLESICSKLKSKRTQVTRWNALLAKSIRLLMMTLTLDDNTMYAHQPQDAFAKASSRPIHSKTVGALKSNEPPTHTCHRQRQFAPYHLRATSKVRENRLLGDVGLDNTAIEDISSSSLSSRGSLGSGCASRVGDICQEKAKP